MVGIPSGRFSVLPGLGIHTRRTGCATYLSGDRTARDSCSIALYRFSVLSQSSLSTPAVLEPELDDTLLTATARAAKL